MKFDLPNDENDYMILESIKSAPAKVIHVFDLKHCNGLTDNANKDQNGRRENSPRAETFLSPWRLVSKYKKMHKRLFSSAEFLLLCTLVGI